MEKIIVSFVVWHPFWQLNLEVRVTWQLVSHCVLHFGILFSRLYGNLLSVTMMIFSNLSSMMIFPELQRLIHVGIVYLYLCGLCVFLISIASVKKKILTSMLNFLHVVTCQWVWCCNYFIVCSFKNSTVIDSLFWQKFGVLFGNGTYNLID